MTYFTKYPFYIESGNVSLESIKKAIEQNPYPQILCPEATPVFNGTACYSCPGYYDFYILENNTCLTPHSYTNVQVINDSNRYIEKDNYTLKALNDALKALKVPVAICNAKEPLYNGTACISCP